MDLTVSIVTYNSEEHIRACLEAIYAHTSNLDFEVHVVDNASTDGTPEIVREVFPQAHLVRNTTNVGFGAGNNLVLRETRARYALVLNPDVLVSPGSLEAMVSHMDANRDIGALGCKLLNTDRSLQFSCRRYPEPLVFLLRVLFLDRLVPGARPLRRYLMQDWDHNHSAEVDWLMAACMMLRTSVLREVGLFDEQFFLYYEDVDLCRRISYHSRIYYCSGIEMLHHHRQQSHGLRNVRCTFQHLTSAYRYFRKWRAVRNPEDLPTGVCGPGTDDERCPKPIQ